MRISDWSSDVFSSDLISPSRPPYAPRKSGGRGLRQPGQVRKEAAATNSPRVVPASTHFPLRQVRDAPLRRGHEQFRRRRNPDAGDGPARSRAAAIERPVSRPRAHISPANLRRTDRSGCDGAPARSEEHTSELQSLMRLSYAVFYL